MSYRGGGMTNTHEPPDPEQALSNESAEVLELDHRLEVALDELLAVRSEPAVPALPADFTARVLSARPFAPWEVRRGRSWRFPVLAGASLVAASGTLFVAPVWRL